MVIILIRRFVKAGCEDAFLKAYEAERARDNPDFHGETLIRVNSDAELPVGLKSFELSSPDCATYINVAKWSSWEAFGRLCDMSGAGSIADYEVRARERAVLDVVRENK